MKKVCICRLDKVIGKPSKIFSAMDTERFLKVPDQNDTAIDKYAASIELSNACRQFYKSRVEAAHCIKSRWERHSSHRSGNDNDRPADDNSTQRRQKNSIDKAMDRLRTEMVSGRICFVTFAFRNV